jgi:hypothetical protein
MLTDKDRALIRYGRDAEAWDTLERNRRLALEAPPARDLTVRPAVASPGALARWSAELCAGTRTRLTRDWLWRAACHEATGADFDRCGLPHIGDDCRRQAEATMKGSPQHSRKASAPSRPFAHVKQASSRWAVAT